MHQELRLELCAKPTPLFRGADIFICIFGPFGEGSEERVGVLAAAPVHDLCPPCTAECPLWG